MTSADSMPSATAFELPDAATAAQATPAAVKGVRLNVAISIERASTERLRQIDAQWTDLVARASEPNAFMDPAVLRTLGGKVVTLLAWHEAAGICELVGVWAFARSGVALIPALRSPPFIHAYLATPVIDRARVNVTLAAMLDYLARSRDLPNLISLDPMRLDGPTMAALRSVVGIRGGTTRIVSSTQRPVLASELDGKQYFEKALSSSSRKKLRQHRRRLEERGVLDCVVYTALADVEKAFEDFLWLENAGWKGQQGTALLSRGGGADLARKIIAGLAQRGDVSVHAIYQHARPVAVQIVWRAGATAFTWKTAYDEALGDYSPGMLLLENYTAAFLADKSITMVNSCAYDDSSFMSVWQERELIGQLLVRPDRRGALAFEVAACLQTAFLRMRTAAKRIYWLWRQQWKRK